MSKPNSEAVTRLRKEFDKIRSAKAFSSPEAQKVLGNYSDFLFSERPDLNEDQVNRLNQRMKKGFAPVKDLPDIRYNVDDKQAFDVISTFNKRMFPTGLNANQTFIDLGGRPAITGNFKTGSEIIKGEPVEVRTNKVRYNLYPDKENKISDDEFAAAKRMKEVDKAIAVRYYNDFVKGTDLEKVYNRDNALETYNNINSNPELKARFSKMYYDDNKWKQMVSEEGAKLGYGKDYVNEYFGSRSKIYGKDIVGGDGAKEYNDNRSLYGFRNSLATIEPETTSIQLNNDLEIPNFEQKEWQAGSTYYDDGSARIKCSGGSKPTFKPKEVLCGLSKAPKSRYKKGGLLLIEAGIKNYKKSL